MASSGRPTRAERRRTRRAARERDRRRSASRRRWRSIAGWLAGIAAVVGVLAIVAAANVGSGPRSTAGPGGVSAADPVLGQADAPVTIIEYGDFKCPFCTRFAQETKPQLVRDYVDTGKFGEWRRDHIPDGLRRYTEHGEVTHWRLEARLGPIGDAFLAVHEYLADGR